VWVPASCEDENEGRNDHSLDGDMYIVHFLRMICMNTRQEGRHDRRSEGASRVEEHDFPGKNVDSFPILVPMGNNTSRGIKIAYRNIWALR